MAKVFTFTPWLNTYIYTMAKVLTFASWLRNVYVHYG